MPIFRWCSCTRTRVRSMVYADTYVTRVNPFCETHGDPLVVSRVHTTPMSEELIAALVEAVKENDSP